MAAPDSVRVPFATFQRGPLEEGVGLGLGVGVAVGLGVGFGVAVGAEVGVGFGLGLGVVVGVGVGDGAVVAPIAMPAAGTVREAVLIAAVTRALTVRPSSACVVV